MQRSDARMEDDAGRLVIVIMSAGLLVAVLLAVVSFAKYDSLVSEVHEACQTAAALDLSGWVKVCKSVNYRE